MASTFEWVRSPFAYVQSTGVALAVAPFFGLAYLTVWWLGGYGRVESSAASHKLSYLWAAAAPVECQRFGPITVAPLAIWWFSGASHTSMHKKGRVREDI